MAEIRVWNKEYHLLGSFAAYSRATEYECINCNRCHPVGELCPTLNLNLGNSSGERNGKG